MRASVCSRSSTTFVSNDRKRASHRRRPITALAAHRMNHYLPPPWKGTTYLHSLNVARGVEEARRVPLLEREAEEVEGELGVQELGSCASASGAVANSKVPRDRTWTRLARRHPHLAEQHPVRGRDLSEEKRFRRQQGCNTSHTVCTECECVDRSLRPQCISYGRL